MNRELIWLIEDSVKELFKINIKNGASFSSMKFTSEDKTEEETRAVNRLLEGGYIDLTLTPGTYIISKSYYEYLKDKS